MASAGGGDGTGPGPAAAAASTTGAGPGEPVVLLPKRVVVGVIQFLEGVQAGAHAQVQALKAYLGASPPSAISGRGLMTEGRTAPLLAAACRIDRRRCVPGGMAVEG